MVKNEILANALRLKILPRKLEKVCYSTNFHDSLFSLDKFQSNKLCGLSREGSFNENMDKIYS